MDCIRACLGSIAPYVGTKNESTLLAASDLSKLVKGDPKLLTRAKQIRDKCSEVGYNVQGVQRSLVDGLLLSCGIRLVHLVFSKANLIEVFT